MQQGFIYLLTPKGGCFNEAHTAFDNALGSCEAIKKSNSLLAQPLKLDMLLNDFVVMAYAGQGFIALAEHNFQTAERFFLKAQQKLLPDSNNQTLGTALVHLGLAMIALWRQKNEEAKQTLQIFHGIAFSDCFIPEELEAFVIAALIYFPRH